MSEFDETVVTAEDEEDVWLPDGWSGSDDEDFFDLSTWGSKGTAADARQDGGDEDESTSAEDAEDPDRTTDADPESQTEPSDDLDDPTTVIVDDERNLLRFKATIDHVAQNVELDPADLPAVYQKSLVLDRYQARVKELEDELSKWDKLATGLKYKDRAELHEGLFEGAVQDYLAEHPSVPEDLARDYISRQFDHVAAPTPKEPEQQTTGGRDFKQEVADLFRTYPSARIEGVPEEVSTAALVEDKPLVQAYAEWRAKTASAKATRTERENKILKQNQAAAARAPVKKVTGGGKTDTSPTDAFLQGFNDDAW